LPGGDHVAEVAVDVGKGEGHPLGMADGDPVGALRGKRQACGAALEDTGRLVERGEVELVGLLLRPAQAARLAENLEPEAVGAADGEAAGPRPANRAAAHPEGGEGIVLELAALDAVREVARHPGNPLAGDVA